MAVHNHYKRVKHESQRRKRASEASQAARSQKALRQVYFYVHICRTIKSSCRPKRFCSGLALSPSLPRMYVHVWICVAPASQLEWLGAPGLCVGSGSSPGCFHHGFEAKARRLIPHARTIWGGVGQEQRVIVGLSTPPRLSLSCPCTARPSPAAVFVAESHPACSRVSALKHSQFDVGVPSLQKATHGSQNRSIRDSKASAVTAFFPLIFLVARRVPLVLVRRCLHRL